MMNRVPLLQVALAVCLLVVSTFGHAFKIDTHLWVGQQVINDLEDDGKVTVKLRGRPVTLPVPTVVKDAILNNRNAYLLGNIGPDAMPDVVVGQSLVHPGSPNGWKTNHWLNFLLTKSQNSAIGRALAYGYLGHAAADTFAHTYVNQYAGDIFDLRDENLVEQRHVALESFISRFNPPFLNSAGQNLGAPWALTQPDNGVANFVRDTLILDEQAAAANNASTSGKHLVAYREYRNVVNEAANSPVWDNISAAVIMIVANVNDINITYEQSRQLVDFLNNEVIPRLNSRIDLTQEQINRVNNAINQFDAARFAELNSALRRVMDLNSTIAQKLADRLQAQGRLCQEVSEQVCYWVACCLVHKPWPLSGCAVELPYCNQICNSVTTRYCKYGEEASQAAADLIRRIDEELNGSGGLWDQVLSSAGQTLSRAIEFRDRSLRLAQSIIDLGQILGSNIATPKALLENWVKDLDLAMSEYIKASTQMMLNTLNPAANPLEPMQQWWECYHQTLVGNPLGAPIGVWLCGFQQDLQATWKALENLAKVIEDAQFLFPNSIANIPTPSEIRAMVEDLKNRAIRKLTEAAIHALVDLLPQNVQDLIIVLRENMTDERLRYYFTKPETGSPKKLLMIGDVDQRVKAEMQLTSSNRYDPERYAVVYNAVVLAKLALLDSTGLALLAQEAGVSTATFVGTTNVLANAVASIDGNHQWMPIAPPRPDSDGLPYRAAGPGSDYDNTGGYASAAGFVPWKQETRSALFRSLFIGPLSPGIESPGEIGLPEVLRPDYPYRPCRAYPFPSDENDKTCAALKVLPVILQLLLED